MARFFLSSLRSRAILLVLLAVLPLLALTLYSHVDQRKRAISEVQRDELVAARNLAAILETLIRNNRQLLETLVQLPQVQRRDPDGCNALFASLLVQTPYLADIGAADHQGWVFASAPAASEPVNLADRPYFRKTVLTRAFAVGEPLLCRLSGKYGLTFSYPILDDMGHFQGLVFVSLDLHWLGSLLAKSDFPDSSALLLADAKGKVLFRYPQPLEYLGRMAPNSVIKAMANQVEGMTEGVGLPGDERLFAFARLAPPWHDMCVAIGLPKEWALARVNRDLWRNLMWLAAVALLAVAAARFGGKIFILQPVDKLLEVTRRLTGGDLTARTGAPYKAGELGQLAQAFDHMAASLQERDTEIRKRVRELAERTAQLEAANKEMGDFTYTVSHDLRAPLRSIGGFARVLLEDYPDKLDADGKRYLNIIHQDARKMGRLIDDLLALVRLGRRELSRSRIDMAELARDVCKEISPQYLERKLQIDIKPLPEAVGDRSMLRQVLANLLLNAIKFTKDRDPALIQVSGWSKEHDQIYCVKDNGVGFDVRYVNKLFEVFQRLHPEEEFEGTGVGLAIVKRIIDRHGGRVWAEGTVNEGATFYFALPNREAA